MIESIYQYINTVSIWMWIALPAVLVFVVSYLTTRITKLSLSISVATAACIAFVIGLINWLEYLDNHFVGKYDVSGVPIQISRSGWRLVWDSVGLWLPICVLFIVLTGFLIWLATRLFPSKVELVESKLRPYFGGPTSKDLIHARLEAEKLKQKLAIAEEKYLRVKARETGPSAKETRTTLDIKQMREQLIECRKQNGEYKKEIDSLKADLERTNNLVDHLLEEKYQDE